MVKVLFAGEPGGRIEALFKRVAAVNASNGPFDLLLCTGAFFAGSGAPQLLMFLSKHAAELTVQLKCKEAGVRHQLRRRAAAVRALPAALAAAARS